MDKVSRALPTGMRIGIDFGRNITVVAAAGGISAHPEPVSVNGFSRNVPGPEPSQQLPVIPSEILFNDDGSFSIGEEAIAFAETGSNPAVKQILYYLCEDSPVLVPAGPGRRIGYREAGSVYLTELIKKVGEQYDLASSQITFTLPIGAPQRYVEWILEVAESAGPGTVSTVEIGIASVRGYGLSFEDHEVYVLIDANRDSLDISVISPDHDDGVARGGSRTLGRASVDFSGLTVDTWIASGILSKKRCFLSEEQRSRIFSRLVERCCRAREYLSASGEVPVRIGDLLGCPEDSSILTAGEVSEIFRRNGLFEALSSSLARALSAARVYGCDRERLTAVLMIGEISAFPPFREEVRNRFPTVPVRFEHPLDAAARGAAGRTSSGRTRAVADYALRYWDPVSCEHRFRFLALRDAGCTGTGESARVVISAAYDGQIRMGIPLYRITGDEVDIPSSGLELVGTPGGGFGIAGPGTACSGSFRPIRVNDGEQTFLSASPPAKKGVPRFELTFTFDGEGYLRLSARDLLTGKLVKNTERMFRPR